MDDVGQAFRRQGIYLHLLSCSHWRTFTACSLFFIWRERPEPIRVCRSIALLDRNLALLVHHGIHHVLICLVVGFWLFKIEVLGLGVIFMAINKLVFLIFLLLLVEMSINLDFLWLSLILKSRVCANKPLILVTLIEELCILRVLPLALQFLN